MARKQKRKELYSYTELQVKELCWKLLNSFTNPESLKQAINSYQKDFELWWKENKK